MNGLVVDGLTDKKLRDAYKALSACLEIIKRVEAGEVFSYPFGNDFIGARNLAILALAEEGGAE